MITPVPPDPVEIPAGRLQLRPVSPARLTAIVSAADDALRVAGTLGSAEPAARFIDGTNDWSSGDASWGVFAVDGEFLGSISLFHVDPDQRTAEVGYGTLPAARGQGVASDALKAVCRYAFAPAPAGGLGLRRLQLFHAVDNPASCGVAARAGFALEGTLRQGYRYQDGLVRDEHLHGRLATDP